MSESHMDGHKPSAGELQARSAEKIIRDAQRKQERSSRGSAGIPPPPRTEPAKDSYAQDKETVENVIKELKRAFRIKDSKHGEDKTSEGYPRVISLRTGAVATTPEEFLRQSQEDRKAGEEAFQKSVKESAARIEATNRLPFGQKLLWLISWRLVDPEIYNQILQQVRSEMGLTNE